MRPKRSEIFAKFTKALYEKLEFVDSLPDTATVLKYYVGDGMICTLFPDTYYVDNDTLYIKYDKGKYLIQPYTCFRVSLELLDQSFVLANMKRLLKLVYQDEKYIDEIRQNVYDEDGAREYYEIDP